MALKKSELYSSSGVCGLSCASCGHGFPSGGWRKRAGSKPSESALLEAYPSLRAEDLANAGHMSVPIHWKSSQTLCKGRFAKERSLATKAETTLCLPRPPVTGSAGRTGRRFAELRWALYAGREEAMHVPSAVVNQREVSRLVSEVEQALKNDVASINSKIGIDWSGEHAMFFGVILKDPASKGKRLGQATARVQDALRERLGPISPNMIMYFSFRSQSEQPQATDKTWWM